MLIIFDVDGTLIDSRASIVESARRTFADGPVAYPGDDAFLATIGLLPQRMMATLLPDHPEDMHALLAVRYIEQAWAVRDEQIQIERPYEGIAAMLAAVAKPGRTLGIATGKKRLGVDHMLRQTGWQALFTTLQTAECGPSKPDPTLIHRAMAETRHRSETTIMIGDSVFDMQMARAAGVTAIGVGWGYNSLETLERAGADRLVGTVTELQDLLTTTPALG